MKQFSLEEYLKNPDRKVVTRNGNQIRILATDYQNSHPIVAILTRDEDKQELLVNYTKDGYLVSSAFPSGCDLFFDTVTKEGWQNLYLHGEGVSGGTVRKTREEALANVAKYGTYVDTIKVEWEE